MALRLLAQRDHARAELERKLLARAARMAAAEGGDGRPPTAEHEPDLDPDPEAASARVRSDMARVLDELEARGFLSDQRAADALLHAKAPRYGQRRLRQILQSRALGADLVAATLDKARDTELERAREVWRRRFNAAPVDLRERARQTRFLAARGFEGATIERVLREAAAACPSTRVDED